MKRLMVMVAGLLLAVPSQAQDQAHLKVTVAIDYAVGGPQPASGAEVRLLSRSFGLVLQELYGISEKSDSTGLEYVPRTRHRPSGDDRIAYNRFLRSLAGSGSNDASVGLMMADRHRVATGKTSLEGGATFKALEPGSYWVVSWTSVRGGDVMLWSLPVEISAGEASLELTSENIATKYSR